MLLATIMNFICLCIVKVMENQIFYYGQVPLCQNGEVT